MRKKQPLRITPADLLERRAYVRLSPEAKVRLAHLAGAPWSEVDADAELSEGQQQLLQREERTKVVHGGSGLGKSVLAACEGAIRAMLPFQTVGYLGDVFEHVGKEWKYVDRFYRKLFAGRGGAFVRIAFVSRQNYHDYEVSTIWGSSIRGYSMDHREGGSMLGNQLDMAVLCEGSQISLGVLNRRVLRALDRAVNVRRGYRHSRESGYLSAYTTPDGLEGAAAEIVEQARRASKGHLETLEYGRTSFIRSFFFLEAKSTLNPAYSHEVMAHRAEGMSAWEFEEVYEGKSNARAGRVYSDLLEKHKVGLPPQGELERMRYGLGFDTGTVFACVLFGVDQHGIGWALDEVYEEKTPIEACCKAVSAMLLAFFEPLGYVSLESICERFDLTVIDPSSQFKVDIMEHLPLSLSPPFRDDGEFELVPTIMHLKTLIGLDRMRVVEERCPRGLNEVRKYIWQEQRSPALKGRYITRRPVDDFNHWLDAWRYVAIPMMQLGPLESAEHVVQFAQAYREAQRRAPHDRLKEMMREAEEAGGTWV